MSSPQLLRNNGEFVAKKYFTDHWIVNAIKLLVAIKRNFSGLLFSGTSLSEGELPRDYLVNVAVCSFVHH